MLEIVNARSSAFPALTSFAQVQVTAVTYPHATRKNAATRAASWAGHAVRIDAPGRVVKRRGPTIHHIRLPLMSEPKPQLKSLTMVTIFAHAGITLR